MGLGLRKEGVVGGEAAGSGSWRPGCSLIQAECTGVSPWILREPEPDDLHSLVCYTSVNILLKIKKKGKKPCFFFHILYVLDFKTKAAWFELMGKIFSSSERRGRNGLDFLVEYFPWSQALCYIVLHCVTLGLTSSGLISRAVKWCINLSPSYKWRNWGPENV